MYIGPGVGLSPESVEALCICEIVVEIALQLLDALQQRIPRVACCLECGSQGLAVAIRLSASGISSSLISLMFSFGNNQLVKVV